MEKIKEILNKYNCNDYNLVKDTIDNLCKKGVANGVYQNYQVLLDILAILSEIEEIVKNSGVLK